MTGVNGVLLPYRVMSYVVGVMLLVLVGIGVPLQIAGKPRLVAIVGPVHGALYIVYLGVAFMLARRARFTLPQLAAMVGAGLVPTLAFFVERRITRRVRELSAETSGGGVGTTL